MIDKYEGHTPAPWAWDDLHSSGKEMLFVHRKGNDNDIIANVNGVINGKLECANAQLIADAPLILAEYKKLRDGINYIAYLPSLKPSIAKMMKELIE